MRDGAHFGKYRGMVVNNIDPERRGRLLVTVPDIQALIPSSWAMPCVPFAGIQAGVYVVPPIGAGVWIEFEQGDPEYPIWVGGYWGSLAEVPAPAQLAVPPLQNVVLQTPGQTTLMLSDTPGPTGGILLKTKTGALISINDVGITISNGKGAMIVMAGPAVTVNQGALVVQ
jgi:uncharacterized protein involved in type VI secretion and phage assembly